MERLCEYCYCIDSEDNPLFEIVNYEGIIEELICMMCYVEKLEEQDAEGECTI